MLARLLADLLLLVHVAFVAFVVGGLVLVILGSLRRWAWVRNRAFRIAHLCAIGFVAAQAVLGRLCPLTIWESNLRAIAGEATYRGSFIAHWLEELLYVELPLPVLAALYVVFALLVLAAWFVAPPRPRNRRAR